MTRKKYVKEATEDMERAHFLEEAIFLRPHENEDKTRKYYSTNILRTLAGERERRLSAGLAEKRGRF